MDVTSDTVTAGSMLSGTTATKNDGTKATGTIATKTSSDLTVSGATVTAPAGYYSSSASKSVGTTTHPNPTASIANATGIVTASHTQNTGYVTGGTTTGTLTLTTQGAQTITPSTTDKTISANRWLTGTQTIKGDTNLVADNIAEGVSIFGVSGTHSGASSYTATISGNGNTNYCYVQYNGTKYRANGDTFSYKAGDMLTVYCRGNSFYVNGTTVALSSYTYSYSLPVGDIDISISYSTSTSNSINIYTLVKPSGSLTISSGGTHDVYKYSQATVGTGSAITPATTITVNPTISVDSDGLITATASGSKSITPTVSAGYISSGTAGTVSVNGSATQQLATKSSTDLTVSGATVTVPSGYYPSSASKSVSTVSHPQPTISVDSSTGVITASHTQSTGYVTGGTTTKTDTLRTIGDTTYTPTSYAQTIANPGYYTTGTLTMAAIPDSWVQPSGTLGITENGLSIDVSRYAEVNVTVKPLYPRRYIAHYVEKVGETTSACYLKITNDTSEKNEWFYANTNSLNIGALIDYDEGDSLTLKATGRLAASLYIDDTLVKDSGQDASLSYSWTAPASNTRIKLDASTGTCRAYIYTE